MASKNSPFVHALLSTHSILEGRARQETEIRIRWSTIIVLALDVGIKLAVLA